jgi:cobalamin synthase
MKGEWMTEAEFQRRFGSGRFAWKLWLLPVVSMVVGLVVAQLLWWFAVPS